MPPVYVQPDHTHQHWSNLVQLNFHNIMINYSNQLNTLKDKFTDPLQNSGNFLCSNRQKGDYLSTLLCTNESDFFICLYRVIE